MATYSIGDLDRREILKMSAVLAGSSALSSTKLAAAEGTLPRTPGQILGPRLNRGSVNSVAGRSDLQHDGIEAQFHRTVQHPP